MSFDNVFGLLDLGLVVVTVLGFAVYELWSLRRSRKRDEPERKPPNEKR